VAVEYDLLLPDGKWSGWKSFNPHPEKTTGAFEYKMDHDLFKKDGGYALVLRSKYKTDTRADTRVYAQISNTAWESHWFAIDNHKPALGPVTFTYNTSAKELTVKGTAYDPADTDDNPVTKILVSLTGNSADFIDVGDEGDLSPITKGAEFTLVTKFDGIFSPLVQVIAKSGSSTDAMPRLPDPSPLIEVEIKDKNGSVKDGQTNVKKGEQFQIDLKVTTHVGVPLLNLKVNLDDAIKIDDVKVAPTLAAVKIDDEWKNRGNDTLARIEKLAPNTFTVTLLSKMDEVGSADIGWELIDASEPKAMLDGKGSWETTVVAAA